MILILEIYCTEYKRKKKEKKERKKERKRERKKERKKERKRKRKKEREKEREKESTCLTAFPSLSNTSRFGPSYCFIQLLGKRLCLAAFYLKRLKSKDQK